MENGDIQNRLGKRIVEIRSNLGLKQIDLAMRAEIDDAFLRRIETGRVNPTVRTLEKIARGLDVPMKDLFDF